MVGHYGERTTRVAIGKRFDWPKMKQDVEHFVCTCVKCQNTKSTYKKKHELSRPLRILNKPWKNVSMDFMTQLPEWDECHSRGSQSIIQVGKNGSNEDNPNNF